MRAPSRRCCRRNLLSDVRGTAIERIIIIGAFVFAVVGGVAQLSRSSNTTLRCQGSALANGFATNDPSCPGGGAAPAEPGAGGPVAVGDSGGGTDPLRQPLCDGITCQCFVAGTPVLTEHGLRAIESITPGTRVWARAEHGDGSGWKAVRRTFVNQTDALVRLSLGAGESTSTLVLTPKHPLFVVGRGWTH
ncbi:MAG TPA: Hint domain-containing protein, partial [Polyangia bacterium]